MTMYRLATPILLLSIASAQIAQRPEIAVAAKSPFTLARHIESHREDVDWEALWKELGTQAPKLLYRLCGDKSVPLVYSCSSEIVSVVNPDQAILIIQSNGVRSHDIYLRYLPEANGGWRFAGLSSATLYDDFPRRREIIRVGRKPFLAISSDLSQVGGGIVHLAEDWFDLTQPDFEPVFSFTRDASVSFGYPIGRQVSARAYPSVRRGIDTIDVNLTVVFDGFGRNLGDSTLLGVYQRLPAEKKFTLRSAYAGVIRNEQMPVEDFQALSEVELATEQSIKFTLGRLKEIATGSNDEAKQDLRDLLGKTKEIPEKRTLLELLR